MESGKKRAALVVAGTIAGIVVGVSIAAALFVLRPATLPPPLESFVELTSVDIAWDPGGCNNLFFPLPPQYAQFGFKIRNRAEFDIWVRLEFLVDESLYERVTYRAPAGHDTPPLSRTIQVGDCQPHQAALEIADAWR